MNIDIRKLAGSTTPPIVLLLVSYLFIPQLTHPLPFALLGIYPFLPFVIFIIGMVLSWIFHHSREFNIFLLFTIIYILLDSFIWNYKLEIDYQLGFLLIAILIPINFLYSFTCRERGILNHFGIRRIAILIAQFYGILWLLESPSPMLKKVLMLDYSSLSITGITDIPQIIAVAIILVGIFIFYKLLQSATYLTSGAFFSLIAITTAIHFHQQHQLAIFFIILAGVLIITNMTINAYSLAYLDELTSLPSRRALEQTLSTLGKRYCIAMVDVDHFKKFNDKYGHDIGDQVLKKLASQLRKTRGGKAFRYGGEEFTVVFPGKDILEAKLACEDLCKNVQNNPFMLRNKKRPKLKNSKIKKQEQATPLVITISVGIAERSERLATADSVIKKADKKLYKAKDNGRNQVAT